MASSEKVAWAESRGTYHPLLGTNVEIRVTACAGSYLVAQAAAQGAEKRAVEEMVRLQAVFTMFDPLSELCRWRSGNLDRPSVELTAVLAAAQRWWAISGGAFHPAIAPLRARWLRAEAEQQLPSVSETTELAAELRELPYRVGLAGVIRTGDCSGLDLNAIAKGYIVDRGLAAARICPQVVDVLVNAGGDLRHVGRSSIRVGVEDPQEPGAEPLRVVELLNGAIATSGPVHRGFRIGERWFGHVLDPRTGWPVTERPSTTVRADDAMTADALATVVGVLDWPDAVQVLSAIPGTSAIAVQVTGELRTWGNW